MLRAWALNIGMAFTLWFLYAAWGRLMLGRWFLGRFRPGSEAFDSLALVVILIVTAITARRVARLRETPRE